MVLRVEMDDIDLTLLAELQHDADRSLDELGGLVGLSASAVSRRIAGYRRAGVLRRVVALLDPLEIGVAVHVVCQIVCRDDATDSLGALKSELLDLAEVVQCYEVAGTIDLIAVFATTTTARYKALTDRILTDNPSVQRFESHIALDVARPTALLPMPEADGGTRPTATGSGGPRRPRLRLES